MSNSNMEAKPFLEERSSLGSDEEDAVFQTLGDNSRRKSAPTAKRLSGLLAFLILLNILAFFLQISRIMEGALVAPSPKEPDTFYHSPAESVLKWDIAPVETHLDHYPYAGEPRPEFDRAWTELLRPTAIRLTEAEMRAANRTSVKLRDGTGYAGYLEVFHQLHCVKRMVQFRHPDYYSDLVEAGRLTEDHFNHCVEVLRTGIMCRADVTLNTYHWDQSADPLIPQGVSTAPRQCVDFEAVSRWAEERTIGADFDALRWDEEGAMGPI